MYLIGADGRSRTATDYVHHPLKMACLPISPRRQFLKVLFIEVSQVDRLVLQALFLQFL